MRLLRHTLVVTAILAYPADSLGDPLDMGDPCTGAIAQSESTAAAARSASDAYLAQWDALTYPPDSLVLYYHDLLVGYYYGVWMKDPQTAPLIDLAQKGDKNFDPQSFFSTKIYPVAMNAADEKNQISALFKADYEASIRPKIVAERADLEKALSDQKATLDNSCKQDEVDKLMRVTYGNLAIMGANDAAAAKNEKGTFAQAVRLMSGISLTDITQNGILGGQNSDLRKVAAAGGAGDVLKALQQLQKATSPANIKFPQINPNNWPLPGPGPLPKPIFPPGPGPILPPGPIGPTPIPKPPNPPGPIHF